MQLKKENVMGKGAVPPNGVDPYKKENVMGKGAVPPNGVDPY